MGYTTKIEVRFNDIDTYGHVNNAVYFTYLEMARVKLFKEQFVELTKKGFFFLIAKAECEYKKPISLSDDVYVTIDVEKIGNSSFTLAYNVHNDKKTVFALGRTTLVSFDSKNNKPARVPDEFMKVLQSC